MVVSNEIGEGTGRELQNPHAHSSINHLSTRFPPLFYQNNFCSWAACGFLWWSCLPQKLMANFQSHSSPGTVCGFRCPTFWALPSTCYLESWKELLSWPSKSFSGTPPPISWKLIVISLSHHCLLIIQQSDLPSQWSVFIKGWPQPGWLYKFSRKWACMWLPWAYQWAFNKYLFNLNLIKTTQTLGKREFWEKKNFFNAVNKYLMAIMLQALGSSVVHCDEICHHSASQGHSWTPSVNLTLLYNHEARRGLMKLFQAGVFYRWVGWGVRLL